MAAVAVPASGHHLQALASPTERADHHHGPAGNLAGDCCMAGCLVVALLDGAPATDWPSRDATALPRPGLRPDAVVIQPPLRPPRA